MGDTAGNHRRGHAVAIPLGLACAIYLSEYASPKMRSYVKPVLGAMLAGIPTVVYGYFALTFVTPLLRSIFPEVQVFNALSAAIVVGIMILPMIATLSDNALRAVPDSLRQGAYALGATSYEVTTKGGSPGRVVWGNGLIFVGDIASNWRNDGGRNSSRADAKSDP